MAISNQKIIVFGAHGMLGSDLLKAFARQGDVTGFDLDQVDLTDEAAVKKLLLALRPEVVINCAAYTDVDGCEINKETALKVNAQVPRLLARCCQDLRAKLVHYSTDYIFDGTKLSPYREEDVAHPLNVYGETKWKGEEAIRGNLEDHLIIRTSWLFGANGKNFIKTILKMAQTHEELTVVTDQVGAPTYTQDLVKATWHLLEENATGVVHVTNSEQCSWFDFARKILEMSAVKNVRVLPVTSQQYQRPAVRPKYSVLSNEKFEAMFDFRLPAWSEALREYLKEAGV